MIEENNQIITQVNNQKQETDNQIKSVSDKNARDRVYFLSFICSPNILQDPHNTKERFSNHLWSDKQIKSIRQMPFHVEIAVNHKNGNKTNQEATIKKQLTEQYNLADGNYQKQLKNCKNCFETQYPLLKKIIEQKKVDSQKMFDDWVKSMKGKNFIGWYMPLRDQGPKLRKTVFSKITLKMLGYEPQQFNHEFQKYRDIALEILDGNAYKITFIHYLVTFRKFMSMEVNGDLMLEDCIKQSYLTLGNQMRGKNQVNVKVQMKWYMPNMYSVCFEIVKIIGQNQLKDQQLNQYRNNLMCKIEKTTFSSLSRITRLPKQMNPENTHKICSYQVIREPSIIENTVKEQQSGSQYLLQRKQ